MPSISELSFDSQGRLPVLLLLLLGVAFWSLYVYRRTNPIVSTSLRRLLLVPRLLALVSVALLVFEPVVGLTLNWTQKPCVAVLVDRSASMNLADASGGRPNQVASVLKSEVFRSVGEDANLVFRTFSIELESSFDPAKDWLVFDGQGTNISHSVLTAEALLAEQHCRGIVLVTDGVANEGENLLRLDEKVGVPLFPVAIGSSEEQKDLVIHSASTNEIAYVGTDVPVEIRILNRGFDGQRVAVQLIQEGRIIDSQHIALSESTPEKTVTLHLQPHRAGLFKYETVVPALDGELTPDNNTTSFYVRVLKSKLVVTILAGAPSLDYRFLVRTLHREHRIKLYPFAEQSGGGFYIPEQKNIKECVEESDCLVFLNFPSRDSDVGLWDALQRTIESRHTPVWLIIGERIDFSRLKSLYKYLPLRDDPERHVERQVYPLLASDGVPHPVCILAESIDESRRMWRELPPVTTSYSSLPVWPNAGAVLLSDRNVEPDNTKGEKEPLLVVRDDPVAKSALLLAEGFWRWGMMMWGVEEDDSAYRRFVGNVVRWLSTRGLRKRFTVSTNKDFYRGGETVEFEAQLYSHDFRPIDGAEVSLRLRGPSVASESVMKGKGNGKYWADLTVSREGRYEFEAIAHVNGQYVAADSGEISVARWNLELANTAVRHEELRKMARASGGEMSTWQDMGPLKEGLNLEPLVREERNEWPLWNRPLLLAIIVVLLALEWSIRKRRGMV